MTHAHAYSALGKCLSNWGTCDAPTRNRALAPAPSVQGSRTSEAAARSLTDANRNTKKARIFEVILASGIEGMTAEKIAEVTGLSGDTVRPRIVELHTENKIIRTGHMRLTKSKRMAECWRVGVGK